MALSQRSPALDVRRAAPAADAAARAALIRRLLAGVLFAAVLAHPAACRAAQSGPDPRAVAASVAHGLHVQDRLPSDGGAWNGGETRIDDGATPGSGGSQSHGLPWGWILLAIGAFGAVCVLVFVVAVLLEPVSERRRLGGGDAGERAPPAGRASPREVLASADELAAAGRYTEAMHQLLSDALAVLRKRLDAELSDALTSREILRALTLQPPQQSALRDMISRVEQTWFAKRTAAVDDYDAVRSSFQIFTAAGAAGR
jgi:hypothetical protein